jgi:hypothetical protein
VDRQGFSQPISLGSDIGVYLHGLTQFREAARLAPVEVER